MEAEDRHQHSVQEQHHPEEEGVEDEEDKEAVEPHEDEHDEAAEVDDVEAAEGSHAAEEDGPAVPGRRHANRRLRAAGATHPPSMTLWLGA